MKDLNHLLFISNVPILTLGKPFPFTTYVEQITIRIREHSLVLTIKLTKVGSVN